MMKHLYVVKFVLCFCRFWRVSERVLTMLRDALDTCLSFSYLLLSSWKQQVPEATRMSRISGMVGMMT